MPINRRTASELRASARKILEAGGKITHFSPTGVVSSLIEIASTHLQEFYDTLEFHNAMSNLSTASGLYLDIIGEDRGVSRTQPLTSSVSFEERNIRFYSKDGSSPIFNLLTNNVIASGSQITNSDGTITYTVSRAFQPDRVQTEIFVSAIASSVGEANNVGRNVLISHALGKTTVGVTNDKPISSGLNVESDSNYRFRIAGALDKAAGATENSLRLIGLIFPEVQNIIFRRFADGVGTYEALIVPVGNEISSDRLLAIRDLLNTNTAFGTRVIVRTPDRLGVELVFQLVMIPRSTEAQKSVARGDARTAVLRYIEQRPIGGVFVLNQVISTILDSNPQIFDTKILVYRFGGDAMVLKDIQAKDDEVFVPDSDVQQAIRVV